MQNTHMLHKKQFPSSTPKTLIGAVLLLRMLLLRKAIVSPADASRFYEDALC
jgi:hypothetical protein